MFRCSPMALRFAARGEVLPLWGDPFVRRDAGGSQVRGTVGRRTRSLGKMGGRDGNENLGVGFGVRWMG
jgi:hypothetical protein